MATPIKKFTLDENRMAKGVRQGFSFSPEGGLALDKNVLTHYFISHRLDSAESECQWGQLALDYQLPPEGQLTIYGLALELDYFFSEGQKLRWDDFFADPSVGYPEKIRQMQEMGACSFRNARNILLYSQTGRYLWFAVEIVGADRGLLKGAVVFAKKESFLQTFPEIYQRDADFFERYLSIFATLYTNVQRRIDSLEKLINIDTAPADMLPILANWIGLEVAGNFLEVEKLRRLIKCTYAINRLKGTRKALVQISQLLLEQEPMIVEQQSLGSALQGESKEVYQYLFGTNPLGITILVKRAPNEKFHSQFLFIINQFKPARSQINLVFLQDTGQLDTHCYLDVNAALIQNKVAGLDDLATFSSNIVLQ